MSKSSQESFSSFMKRTDDLSTRKFLIEWFWFILYFVLDCLLTFAKNAFSYAGPAILGISIAFATCLRIYKLFEV